MKVLLHACCGPCSIEPARLLLEQGHDITIAYLNSNIDDSHEYKKRLDTLLAWADNKGIEVVEGVYDPKQWNTVIAQHWHEGDDRALRCQACYRFRFDELAQMAAEGGYDAIGTTLSVSPYQYTQLIEEMLNQAAAPYPELAVLFTDYRPYYPAATQKSRELEMYRQNFCGCHWSNAEAAEERAERARQRKQKKAEEKQAKLRSLTTSDFDYDLPQELIAQTPHPTRDGCKMLVMKRENGSLQDRIFRDIYDYLKPGDLLVANETRVIPARLLGNKHETGGAAEVLLLRERFDIEEKTNTSAVWEALVKPGRRLKPDAIIDFTREQNDSPSASSNDPSSTSDSAVIMQAEVLDWIEDAQKGERLVRLTTPLDSLDEALHQIGHTPLPPYIKNYQGDEELYQTVFSREEKSAAAPTAGLHFTPELIERLKEKGVGFETVHLEVGLDTFRVVETEDPHEHHMHTEYYSVPQKTVDAIKRTKEKGGRVIAVGTTSVRSLESAWDSEANELVARERQTTNLFIFPGYTFNVVDALITNFHVPRSTLMMLVSAFSSRDNIMKAYRHAIKRKYRLLSFGDAMFIY